jgi:hypothetical protein
MSLDPSGLKAGDCEYVPGYFHWVEDKWHLIAYVPGNPVVDIPYSTNPAPGDTSNRYIRAYYGRRYVELYKCCDATDNVQYIWGNNGVATAWVESTSAYDIATTIGLNLSFKNVNIASFQVVLWSHDSNPQWSTRPGAPTSAITWSSYQSQMIGQFKLVGNINCACDNGTPLTYWPASLPNYPRLGKWNVPVRRPGTTDNRSD